MIVGVSRRGQENYMPNLVYISNGASGSMNLGRIPSGYVLSVDS